MPTTSPATRRQPARTLLTLITLGAVTALAACTSPSSDSTSPPVNVSAPTIAAESTAATTPTTVADTLPAPTTTELATPIDPLLIPTDLGPVQGRPADVTGVRAFLSIPYVAPPTGPNRWRDPQPIAPWTDALDATNSGAACPQIADSPSAQIIITPDWDEDCLTLSVWAPDAASDLPVMVWFHGGSLVTGSAHNPYYNGDLLAAKGAVVIGVNYRLGALGWLADASLAAGSEDGSFGNYGLADQAAALQWVQRNASLFGGNPEAVTIFGESAGGFSVCAHLASPKSAGLFQRAIIQSGGGCDRLQSTDDAQSAAESLRSAVGCADVDCMRELPAETLAAMPFDAQLVRDGVTLGRTAFELAEAGELTDVSVMTGSNDAEATLFTIGQTEPTDAELAVLVNRAGGDPESVLAIYPRDRYETNLARFQDIFTESVFTCPALRFASVAPTAFSYYYSYVPAANPFGLGATHGAEIAAVFGHPEGLRGVELTLDETTTAVIDQVQDAWIAFATTGVPRPDWPEYSAAGEIMEIGASFAVVDEIRDGRCPALLQAIGSR